MFVKDLSDELNRLLFKQKEEAEDFITSTASASVATHFSNTFSTLTNSLLSYRIGSDQIQISFPFLYDLINRWKSEVEQVRIEAEAMLSNTELPATTNRDQIQEVINYIDGTVIDKYQFLGSRMVALEIEFYNIAVAFQTQIESALNDMLIFHNNYYDVTGDFSRFTDISIYLHGIESSGVDFREGISNYSKEGDIVVHQKSNGKVDYYIVLKDDKGELILSDSYTEKTIAIQEEFLKAKGKVHLIYETEFENEHRKKTSNDLARTLIDLGLMYGEKDFRLFAHSYGGRRSLQFAMDHPDFVEAITTIGTPYDTNEWARLALDAAELDPLLPEGFKRDPLQYGHYVDIHSLDSASLGELLNDNAYGDMASVHMGEVLDELQVVNPVAYQQLQDMYITTVAVQQNFVLFPSSHDGAVNIESQGGRVISDLVDADLIHNVFGIDLIDPAHGKELQDTMFMEIMKHINDLTIGPR